MFVTVFLVTTFIAFVAILRGGFFLIQRQWTPLRRISTRLALFLALYAAVLIGVSLASPGRVLEMGETLAFDHWCVSVERAEKLASIGEATCVLKPNGSFYVVTLKVSNSARRAAMRASDPAVYLTDCTGTRYDPSPEGQRVLDASGAGGVPLTTLMAPGGSFTRALVFDLPPNARQVGLVVTHGLFPGALIIADAQSFLHKRTTFRLDVEEDSAHHAP